MVACFGHTNYFINRNQFSELYAIINVVIGIAIMIKIVKGYFINREFTEAFEYESSFIHSIRVVSLTFGFFYLFIFICLIVAVVLLIV